MRGLIKKIEIEQTITDQNGNEYITIEEVYNEEREEIRCEFWKSFSVQKIKKDGYEKMIGKM